MILVRTRMGVVHILEFSELIEPTVVGAYTRSYCPIHGGDNQRSLSIHIDSGWGRCFNLSCPAYAGHESRSTVLLLEHNPEAVSHLMQNQGQWVGIVDRETSAPPERGRQKIRSAVPALYQRQELGALYELYRNGLLRSGLTHPWSRAYLSSRNVPLSTAVAAGVGYLPEPDDLPFDLWHDEHYRCLTRWCNRMIFPLGACWNGTVCAGFIGRTLFGWTVGLDENVHKSLIDDYNRACRTQATTQVKRWCKTNPAGWFGYEPARFAPLLVIVEGAFDRLALLADGWNPTSVVALVGTAGQGDWIPRSVRIVIVALDADAGGVQGAPRLSTSLLQAGFEVHICLPPRDGVGKDWSERWRKAGRSGLQPLYDLCRSICPSFDEVGQTLP